MDPGSEGNPFTRFEFGKYSGDPIDMRKVGKAIASAECPKCNGEMLPRIMLKSKEAFTLECEHKLKKEPTCDGQQYYNKLGALITEKQYVALGIEWMKEQDKEK